MRSHLYRRLQALSDKLASDLTELVLERVELMVTRTFIHVGESLDVAMSAFSSDLDSSATAASAVEDNPRPTKRSRRAATPGQSASSAAGNVAKPHRSPGGHRRTDAVVADTQSRKRKPNSCSKCGAIGFTAATCGRTHNVPTSPAGADDAKEPPTREVAASPKPPTTSREEVSAPPTPRSPSPATSPIKPLSRSERFALIEAAAERRRAREQRARRAAGAANSADSGDGAEATSSAQIDIELEALTTVARRAPTFEVEPL